MDQCIMKLPELPEFPEPNVTVRNWNIIIPSNAKIGEKIRASNFIGNLNRSRY